MNPSQKNAKFMLYQDMQVVVQIRNINYENEYMSMMPTGLLTIKAGYCSDGCSPSFRLPWGMGVIGMPNGELNVNTGQPMLAPAYNAHDVLLEYRRELGITAEQAHEAFCHVINSRSIEFAFKTFYCYMVRKFGPKDKNRLTRQT